MAKRSESGVRKKALLSEEVYGRTTAVKDLQERKRIMVKLVDA